MCPIFSGHLGLNSSKFSSKSKNNKFQFYEDEKYTEKFCKMDFELFDIYMDEKHILVFNKLRTKINILKDKRPKRVLIKEKKYKLINNI